MKNAELITMLGKQYLPSWDTLQELNAIVEDQTGDTSRLDEYTCNSALMIAISSYNYGVMTGKRIERRRCQH